MTQNARFVLSGLCAGLSLVIAAEFQMGRSNSPHPETVSLTSPPIKTPLLGPDMEAIMASILERPLFTPGRHPASIVSLAPAPEPKEETRQLRGRLAGVMIRPGVREALFIGEGKRPMTVNLGSEIDGWKIMAIEVDGVVISSAIGSQTIKPTNDPEPVHPLAHPIPMGIGLAPSIVSNEPPIGLGGNSADRAARVIFPATANPILDALQFAARTGGRGAR